MSGGEPLSPEQEAKIAQWRMRILGLVGESESISDVLRAFAREIQEPRNTGLPIKYGRDHSGKTTLQELIDRFLAAQPAGRDAFCDVVDAEFIFGCYGHAFKRDPYMAKDVRGMLWALCGSLLASQERCKALAERHDAEISALHELLERCHAKMRTDVEGEWQLASEISNLLVDCTLTNCEARSMLGLPRSSEAGKEKA